MHGHDIPGAGNVKPAGVDFAVIRDQASRQADRLVRARLPRGKREGDEWIALNPTRSDSSPGSFKINLRTGEWADFATGDKGGDLISLWAYLDGSSQTEAARRLAAELGIEATAEPAGLTLEAYSEAKRLPADFLRGLGLTTVPDPWGKPRQLLSIPYRRRDGSLYRCRLRGAMAKGADGTPRMVWDKRPKKIGALLYGLDQLPAKGCPVLLVEGESDCHTLWHRGYDAIGCPGAGNFNPARDDTELEGYEIIALIEPDQGGAALLRQLCKSKCRSAVKIARLDGFKDVSEVHLRAPERFDEVLKAAIADAEPLDVLVKRTPEPDAGREVPVVPTEIKLAAGEQARITDEALAIIQAHGTLYERGGALVRLSGDRLIEIDENWMADYLSRYASFYRMKERDGEFVRVKADAPAWLCKRVGAKSGERELPELAGIINAPTLRCDGSLLDKPGFDTATGLLLRQGAWPPIPERPSRNGLEAAWRVLWLPFSEFPYVSNDDRAVAATAILTAIVRRTLPLAPAFSFDAPAASSGKTLLAKCVAELCCGEPNIVAECAEEEIRKRILSVLMDGQPCVLLDNIKGMFRSSALEAFLTTQRYSDRVLGASKIARLPTNVLLLISGNNFVPVGDLWRRILTCRIDPRSENAHLRTFNRDAEQYVHSNRQDMVVAGLTLLRGFIAAGSPRATVDKLGSYEVWDGLVRQCVIWLGIEGIAPVTDPALSIAKAKALDPETQKLTAFLTSVHAAMGESKWRVADIVTKANRGLNEDAQALHDALIEIAGDRNIINTRILGAWLTKQTDRRCGGLHVERAGLKDGNNRWCVTKD